MKKLFFSIALLFGLIGFSQTSDELFSAANNLYQEGKYTEAIEVYSSIEKQGLKSADLFFNLGNCYYKLNKVAPSIYNYEKALKINATHEDALINLTFAKRMTIDAIEELPKTFLQRFSLGVIQKLPFDSWAIIAVLASFLASILFLMYHFSTSSKKKLFYFNTSILATALLIVTVLFAYHNFKTVKNNRTAIIFIDKVEIKNAPSTSSEEVFELHEGTKVVILDELENWKKIKIADGKIGWIYTDDLKEIN
ncbi:MAG: hypothetical protein COC16_05565 [Lutibacter sp.]|nr:MAG: hypothetical protein COC16_05565 [Lutibacter sp.]PHS52859.1 MAG: hypothetical protein COB01_06560 [Lutibacter sp.]